MDVIPHIKGWAATCVRFVRRSQTKGTNRRAAASALLASRRPDGQMEYVQVDPGEPPGPVRVSAIAGERVRALHQGRRDGRRTIVLLPKSAYLIRRLQLPTVETEEMPALLRLEVGATMPDGFGPVEVSYRWLSAGAGKGPRACEVYISRLETLNDYLNGLRRDGVVADTVLPSAAIWAGLLSRWQDLDVLLSSDHDAASVEAAALSPDGSCLVRAIRTGSEDAGKALGPGFTEFLRSLGSSATHPALRVGCLGTDLATVADGRVTAENLTQRLEGGAPGAIAPLTHAAATILPQLGESGLLETANLMPHELVARSRQRIAYRQATIGAAAVILAILVSLAALKLATFRCRLANRELAGRIAHIGSQGEVIGRQIAQLEAIRATRSCSNDLARVIAALAASTPAEVGYSDVELSETGMIRLRGQAESISLPFLLPEELEKQPALAQVVLQNVGQQQKGAGAASEFRIDCALEKGQQTR